MTHISITAVVSLLSLFNLLLMLGVIRRLREQDSRIRDMSVRNDPQWRLPSPIPGIGELIDEFTAETVDGAIIDHRRVFGGTVIFLDASCDSCHDRIPDIINWAKNGRRENIFAFVNGHDADKADMIAALNPVAQVVSDTFQLHVTKSFRVRKFPVYLTLDPEGIITAAGEDFHALFKASAR
ncbi:hypothetical protein [Nonomuraea sp. NPDC049400]|uniref:hypothetical protein n=1 Tax=Nonomuraea sp. NPDC049400 TaxID=3364352 RepID=UPI0037917564